MRSEDRLRSRRAVANLLRISESQDTSMNDFADKLTPNVRMIAEVITSMIICGKCASQRESEELE